jgi:hypothetical protein
LRIFQIADFGLAARIDPTNYAEFSRFKGTPGYYTPAYIKLLISSQNMTTDQSLRNNFPVDGHTGMLRDVTTLMYGEHARIYGRYAR